MRSWSFFMLVPWILLAGACGRKAAPQAAPVPISGRVVDKSGKAVGNMMLTFNPLQSDNQGERPIAQVDSEGRFATSCIPGQYHATLIPIPKSPGHGPEGNLSEPEKPKIDGRNPLKAMRGQTHPAWDIEVKPSGNEDFRLQVR